MPPVQPQAIQQPQQQQQLPPHVIKAYAMFAEASKKDMKTFEQDATAIGHVITNRTLRPDRFGVTTQDVVMSPDQFSGVGGEEWIKAETGKLTGDEKKYLIKAFQLASGIDRGLIPDPTDGADHYYNKSLASPAWGKKDSAAKVKMYENYYDPKMNTKDHSFYKETLKNKKTK